MALVLPVWTAGCARELDLVLRVVLPALLLGVVTVVLGALRRELVHLLLIRRLSTLPVLLQLLRSEAQCTLLVPLVQSEELSERLSPRSPEEERVKMFQPPESFPCCVGVPVPLALLRFALLISGPYSESPPWCPFHELLPYVDSAVWPRFPFRPLFLGPPE